MEKAVDFTRLEKNIIEVIQEEQIKLGYRSELIRLYYPITSLNRFFHTDAAEKEMSELLAEFSKKTVQTPVSYTHLDVYKRQGMKIVRL